MRLRQTLAPAPQSSWTEYFYAGELKVVNGEVETDNPSFIENLLSRGFTPVEDEVVAEDESETQAPARATRKKKEAANGL
jgi:hypothetical protein